MPNMLLNYLLPAIVPLISALFFIVICDIYEYLAFSNIVVIAIMLFSIGMIIKNALVRKFITSSMYGFGVVMTISFLMIVGGDSIRRYIYITDIIISSDYAKNCIPLNGIEVNNIILRVCKKYDFGSANFVDVVVRIDGGHSAEAALSNIEKGDIEPSDAKKELIRFGGIWQNSFSSERLTGKYFLIKNRLS